MAKRLSKTENTEARLNLSTWHSPEDLLDAVKRLNALVGSENLFNQSGLEFIRDAWIASNFGLARKAQKVRLISDEWPDFALQIDGDDHQFEAVEAMDPSRKRGEEYRVEPEVEFDDDPLKWALRAMDSMSWVRRSCQKKANKYGQKASLVVYLNMEEYGIHHREVISLLPTATEPARDSFEEVWVLWGGDAYQASPR